MRLALAVPDGTLPVTLAEPDGPAQTAVLVVQEAFGVTSHIADVARRAAAAGHLALAPHLFHRTGDPELSYDDLPSVWPHFSALTAEGLAADVDACLVELARRGIGPRAVAVVGFCMGGTVALAEGARLALGAAVSFYGGGVAEGRFGYPPLLEVAPALRTPWLGLYGDRDSGIPVEQVEALRAAAATAAVDTDVVRYDADHGFHCDDRPAVFAPDAASDAWQRALRWVDAHVRPA